MKILELLQKAKKLYLEHQGKVGMCWCIKVIANQDKHPLEQSRRGQVPYASIKAQIPEFNPFYLKSYKAEFFAINQQLSVGLEFWWEIDDIDSRIRAFDTLIKLYEDIDREFVW